MSFVLQTPDTSTNFAADGSSYAITFASDVKPALADLESSNLKSSAMIQMKLNRRLGPEYIAQRPSPGGGPKLTYVEGWRIIMLANEVFGYNGWSSSVLKLETDFCDVHEETKRVSCGISATIRVTLKDGTFHEDLGYGTADNLKSKGAALDKAKKEAVTDGVKRALRNFGNLLGLCLYEKQFTQEIVKIKPQPQRKFDDSDLYRRADFDTSTSSISTPPAAGSSTVKREEREDVKPQRGLPPHMRALVQQSALSPLNGKGKTPQTPLSTGLNTPAQSPAASTPLVKSIPPPPRPQQSPQPHQHTGQPSRPQVNAQTHAQNPPAPARPFAPQSRPCNALASTSHSSTLARQPPSAQPATDRRVAFASAPVPAPVPQTREPSLPLENLKAETSDDLDAFFGSDDDALLAAYDGVGVEAATKQAPGKSSALATSTNDDLQHRRPPSQPSGGFRFPPNFSATAARPPQNPSTGSSIVGVKRPAEAMSQQNAVRRPLNGQGMGFAHQQQQQRPLANLDVDAGGGDVKRIRR